MIKKIYGIDFTSQGGALTLNVDEVSDADPIGGSHSKTHSDGWTITGTVCEDYYRWVNWFKAEHPVFGLVEGDFECEVIATSEEGFQHFYENHEPEAWDYRSI